MNGDELERMLDDALASYSLHEPRAGLSGRVMARVRTEHPARRKGWLLFAFAAAGLACLAIAITTWRTERHPQVVLLVAHAPLPPPVPTTTERSMRPPQPDSPRQVDHPQTARRLPRRETLPSPYPLTPEERTLIALAQQAPNAVRWLAQPDRPLKIDAIDIQPLEIEQLSTGENQ